MKSRLFTASLLIIAFAFIALSCNNRKPQSTSTSGTATVVCDETFAGIIGQEVEMFCYSYPDAHISPFFTNENAVIDSLAKGKTSLIITSRLLDNAQKDSIEEKDNKIFAQRIALDAIAIIVNNANTLDELSMSDIRDILNGKSLNWNNVEPSSLGSIQIAMARPNNSITKYLSDTLLNGKPITAGIAIKNSGKDVIAFVRDNADAIGIVSVSQAIADTPWSSMDMKQKTEALQRNDTTTLTFNSAIKVLKIRKDDQLDGFQPYQAYMYDGRYPLCQSIYAISTAPLGSLSSGFLSFITGFNGQKILQNAGLLPGAIQPRMVSQ